MDADSRRRSFTVVLLLAGVAGWIALYPPLAAEARLPWQVYLMLGPWGPGALAGLSVVAIALGCFAPVRTLLGRATGRARGSSVVAAIVAGAYLWATAASEHRQRFPYVQDELSYLIQAHQLARFHLWYGAHPLGKFFDSFQLLTDGVYASAYFPGNALLHVPGVWLGIAPWVTDLVLAAAVVGLVHWIVSEMVDGTAGWIAVLLLLASQLFRGLSVMTLAQVPLLLFGLLAVVCWMRWRVSGRWVWAVGIGFCLGLAAITRPVDALCFALPLGIAVLMDLQGRKAARSAVALMILGASPWLGMQLVCNYGITGRVLTTPFRVYADRDYPGTAYGFSRDDANARPRSDLPQKQLLYEQDVGPLVVQHRPSAVMGTLLRYRLPLTLSLGGAVTPFPLLSAFLPASLLGLSRRRWVVWVVWPLFLLLYVPYAFFFAGYTLVAAPALVLGAVVAARVLPRAWPKAGMAIVAGASAFLIGLAVAALPQWDASVKDDLFDAQWTAGINAKLATVRGPAVVLFRFSPNHNLNEEPVYNADVAWPDDATVIRAHDLGEAADLQLYRYYAQRQPTRRIYLFDEKDGSLRELGKAGELAARGGAL